MSTTCPRWSTSIHSPPPNWGNATSGRVRRSAAGVNPPAWLRQCQRLAPSSRATAMNTNSHTRSLRLSDLMRTRSPCLRVPNHKARDGRLAGCRVEGGQVELSGMHINEIFAADRTTVSFEFFPPKTEADAQALYESISLLEKLQPSFVSVTYGAGGSTRQLTHDLVLRLKQTTTLDPIPHLTCVCHNEGEIEDILTKYAAAGVSNTLALGGDPPKGI